MCSALWGEPAELEQVYTHHSTEPEPLQSCRELSLNSWIQSVESEDSDPAPSLLVGSLQGLVCHGCVLFLFPPVPFLSPASSAIAVFMHVTIIG